MLDIEEFEKKIDKKSRLLGIDPGKKRIGVAICDENKMSAYADQTSMCASGLSELHTTHVPPFICYGGH